MLRITRLVAAWALVFAVVSMLMPRVTRAAGEPAAPPATPPSKTLDLRVVDKATGKPLAGVKVSARNDCESKPVTATTDADGRAKIAYPAKAAFLSATARHDGFVYRSVTWQPKRDATSKAEPKPQIPDAYTLGLNPGTKLGGVVTNEQGQPIENVTVHLLIPSDRSGASPGASDIEKDSVYDEAIKTDAQGRWTFNSAPAQIDDPWIRLEHPDYISDEMFGMTPMPPVEKLRDGTGTMVMKKGVTVAGTVTDDAGKPLKGAIVAQGSDRFGSHFPKTNTDEAGKFEFKNCRPGTMVLTVKGNKGRSPDLKQITVAQGMPPVEFKLPPAKLLKGRVVDASGKPIADAHVGSDTWRGHRSLMWSTKTDAGGRFTWENAPADAMECDVLKQGYADLRRHPITAAGETEVVVTLRAPLKITGTVVDAETNQPIPSFRVLHGIDWGGGRSIYWERDNSGESTRGKDGKFTMNLSFPRPGHAVLIEADGYLPAKSRVFKDDEGEVALELKLNKGSGLAGVVSDASGKPAAGADVVLVTPSQGVQINNGRLESRRDALVVTTAADGKFSFPPQTDPFLIVAMHDSGYGELKQEELAKSSDIKLKPWGRIEGTVKIGAQPAAGGGVSGWSQDPGSHQPDQPQVYRRMTATADAAGHFALERIVPGKVGVGRDLKISPQQTAYTHSVNVEVKPGETATVQIGGTGRPVVGRIQLPAEVTSVDGWMFGHAMISTKADYPKFEPPAEVKKMSLEERKKWHETWMKSDEGKAYQAAMEKAQQAHKQYAVRVEPDGTFRVDDVPAGTYTFNATANKPPPANQCGSGDDLGTASTEFTIPETPGGRSDETLELPTFAMKPAKQVNVGDVAPAFAFKTLDGKDAKLEDFKGKYVFLDFWATWCGPCVAETPNLKAAYDAHGADARLVMIGLSLDDTTEAPAEYAKKNGTKWVQGYLGDWSKTEVPNLYGVKGIPATFLIGPDGKVIAKNLRGPQVKEEIGKALAR